jgi:pyruvate/2-oxoacid:ferredoxin oxidoreductase beta subunit
MSRRKWAWEAYQDGADTRSVEAAVVEDFCSDVDERIAQYTTIAERTPAVLLGIELALHALRETRDAWVDR